MRDVKSEVSQYIVDNFLLGERNGLGDDTSFLTRGILDSTGVLELILFLEQTFHIHVEDEEMLPENLDSLNAIECYVGRKLQRTPCCVGAAGAERV